MSVANLGCLFLKTQGVKKPEPEWINPYPHLIEKHNAQTSFDRQVALTFMELAKTGDVPRWVYHEFPNQIAIIQSCLD